MGERGKPARALRRARTLPLLATLLPSGWRNERPPQGLALAALSALSALWTFLAVKVSSTVFPPTFQILSLLAGGLLLDAPRFRTLTAVSALCLGVDLVVLGRDEVGVGTLLVVAVTAFACYEFARSREQTGLGAFGGENVLLELRERLQQQGRLPPLPRTWHGEAVVRPAGEAPFAGDFVVSACTGDGFEVALVDVSGKGVAAGTRALLLSGALGGLLGGGNPQAFLSAANAYLLRQRWDEGFATAVHVCVNLRTGSVAVASAGHPPVGRFDAGSGRWSLVQVEGVALGLLEDTTYEVARSQLDPGDALLLYTDGLVEVPGRDLSDGIDKLLGEAERLVSQDYRGGVEALLTRVAGASTDDRGLVLVRRR